MWVLSRWMWMHLIMLSLLSYNNSTTESYAWEPTQPSSVTCWVTLLHCPSWAPCSHIRTEEISTTPTRSTHHCPDGPCCTDLSNENSWARWSTRSL